MVAWWNALTLAEQVFTLIGIAATVLLVLQVILMIVGAATGGGDTSGADADASGLDAHMDAGGMDGAAHLDLSPDIGPFDAGHVAGPGDMDTHLPAGHFFGDGHFHGPLPDAGHMPGEYDLAHNATHIDTAGAQDTDAPPAPPHSSGLHLFTLQGIVTFFALFGWSGLLFLSVGIPFPAALFLALVLGFLGMLGMAVIMRAMLLLQQDGTLDTRNAVGKTATVYIPIHPQRRQPGKVMLLVQDSYAELAAVTDEKEKIPTNTQVLVVGITADNTLVVTRK